MPPPSVVSSALLAAAKLANAGTYRQLLPMSPPDEAWGRTFLLQRWTTIRGDASANFPVRTITQDESAWIDLSRFGDAAFWIDVSGVNLPITGLVSLTLESSPVRDEGYFKPVALPLTLIPQAVNGAVVPYLVRTVRTPTTVPLTRWTRWRLSVPGGAGGKWDATFAIRGAGGSSSFMVPTQLAGCMTWLRADLGVTLSSGNVTTWADQSGKGNDAVAPAGREPAYNVGGHQINGQPTLFFDPTVVGAEKLLQLPAGAYGIGTFPAMHAFVVHRRVAATEAIASRTGFWQLGVGTGETMPGTDGHIRDDCGSNVTYDTGLPPVSVPLNISQVYEVQATSTSWKSAINGLPQGSSGTNTLAFYSPPSLGGQVGFGPWNFYYGDWAEVIVFNRILAASERAMVVNYLNGRYGLGAK